MSPFNAYRTYFFFATIYTPKSPRTAIIYNVTLLFFIFCQVEEFVGRPLQDDEVTNDGGACDEPFGAYLAQVCDETQRVPRDGNDDRACKVQTYLRVR